MVGHGSAAGTTDLAGPPRRAVGIHLMPVVGDPDPRRPSVVIELGPDGAIVAETRATTVEEVVAAVGDGPALVAVDAPLAVPNDRGRRPVDELLGWLDVPVFPAARDRLGTVYGGVRGESLAAALAPSTDVVETVPDLVLRQIAWEGRGERADLAEFRARWLTLRPAPYRPKGLGRAKPAGLVPAGALLARVVDLGGWAPDPRDDWAAIRDAAVIDALACAHVAWRGVFGEAGSTIRIGATTHDLLLPCDVNLDERVRVNVARMADAGAPLVVRRTPPP